MVLLAEVLFWTSLFFLFYTYVGYPLLLKILVSVKRLMKYSKAKITMDISAPATPVTLIITAFNEADILPEKIKNIKELDYPSHLLNILFVLDGSTDESLSILNQHPEFNVLHQPERAGKLAAMNRAIDHVHTPIVIFNDANGFLNSGAIRLIVAHYADPRVGGVSGEKKVIAKSGDDGEGEGLYWKYESLLKQLDSDLLTVVGAAGELFSIRTHLYRKLTNIIIEDFVQSLLLCHYGYVVKYEAAAFSQEEPSTNIRDEVERKIRISAGGFQAIAELKSLWNFFRHPLLTFMYVSHRVLRWTACPLALVFMFITAWILYATTLNRFYLVAGIAQMVFYLFAYIGWLRAIKEKKTGIFRLPFYFSMMNWCVFEGFYRYISRSQHVIWNKAGRTSKI